MASPRWKKLRLAIETCEQCPRLREHCVKIAVEKKREFREWTYWGRPVPGFGDVDARLWIVGLAPAGHGANRTGRVFTGDSSGDWLYHALHASGFANQPTSRSIDDGLKLSDAFVSAAARCAPPENKPFPEELSACAPFLDREYDLLQNKKVILALGAIAFRAVWAMWERKGGAIPKPKPKFAHGAKFNLGEMTLLASYHPSRQNTNTGVLTRKMWLAIFEAAKKSCRA